MTDLERRALLGDRQAQEECTRKGIVLPCPFCGGEAEAIEEDGFYTVVCKDRYCISNDIRPEYREAMVALADWNTRAFRAWIDQINQNKAKEFQAIDATIENGKRLNRNFWMNRKKGRTW